MPWRLLSKHLVERFLLCQFQGCISPPSAHGRCDAFTQIKEGHARSIVSAHTHGLCKPEQYIPDVEAWRVRVDDDQRSCLIHVPTKFFQQGSFRAVAIEDEIKLLQ